MEPERLTHEAVEDALDESMDWPQFFASGDESDESVVPAYYKVEGPNGPVSYMTPTGDVVPTTMYDFAMEAKSSTFRPCERGETPWSDS